MFGNIILGIFVLMIIVMFGIFCGVAGKELGKLNEEMRELKRKQKERSK